MIKYANGDKEWYQKDRLHREDGPAIERANGNKIWYLNGKKHRVNGPAIEYSNGDKSWFLHGVFIKKTIMKINWQQEGF